MIQIQQRGKNLINSPVTLSLTSGVYATVQTLKLTPSTAYTLSTNLSGASFQVLESLNNTVISTLPTFTTGSDLVVETIIQIATSQPTGTYTFNIQLEEGSVATEYEEPWVNELTFDEALMSGEKISQDGNKFYLMSGWHRENKDPYQTVTFSGGTAMLSESSQTDTSIVVDVDTGEIKNSFNSGTAVQAFLNQYDSWTTNNATTTAFTLTKLSLKDVYPVAVNDIVTASGFTQNTTQIVFDNPVASGSSVSCAYPYLDTSYASQAKVFYKGASDSVLIPFDGGISLKQGMNHITITNGYDKTIIADGTDFTIPETLTVTSVQKNNEDVAYSISGTTLTVSTAVKGDVIRIQGANPDSISIVDVESNDVDDTSTQLLLFVKGFSVKEETKYKEIDGLKRKKIPLRTTASGNVKKIVSSDTGPYSFGLSGKVRIITDLIDYKLYILNAQIDNANYDEPEIDSITEGFDFTGEKVVKQ